MFRILVLVLALVAGSVAAWLAMSASAVPVSEAALVTPNSVSEPAREVLVAGADLGSGAKLDETHLRWQAWEGEVPAVFISKEARPDAIETLKGATVRGGGFVTGEPIREDRLAKAGAGYLAGLLPEGKRAIAVRVTAESSAGGFILPDDRVDVIHTAARQGADGQPQVTSRTILSNVRVLAVDQTASENGDGAAVVGKTATIEIEPEQISIITAAEASGSVSLALRSASDQKGPAVAAASEEVDQHARVRVFHGGSSREVEVPSSHRGDSAMIAEGS